MRNVNVVGDCYVSHRNATDHYKITVLRNITQEFRRYYKMYKEIKDEENRIKKEKEEEELKRLRDIQEEIDRKKAEEDEKKRKEEEEQRKKEEAEQEIKDKEMKKDDLTMSKKLTSNNFAAKKNERDAKDKDSKETKDKDKKDLKGDKEKDKDKNKTNDKDKSNDNNTSVLKDIKDKGGKMNTPVNPITNRGGNFNTSTIENKILEDNSDEYCTKSLLEIVKPKFNFFQEQVENYILSNEKFWSKNRKKHYCIIPIDVLPPKIEEVQQDV